MVNEIELLNQLQQLNRLDRSKLNPDQLVQMHELLEVKNSL